MDPMIEDPQEMTFSERMVSSNWELASYSLASGESFDNPFRPDNIAYGMTMRFIIGATGGGLADGNYRCYTFVVLDILVEQSSIVTQDIDEVDIFPCQVPVEFNIDRAAWESQKAFLIIHLVGELVPTFSGNIMSLLALDGSVSRWEAVDKEENIFHPF